MEANTGCIKLKTRTLQGGKQSLFLEYEKDGKRVRESLRLFLFPETSPAIKAGNKDTLRKAKLIQQERLTRIVQHNTGIVVNELDGQEDSLLLAEAIRSFEKQTADKGDKSTVTNIQGMFRAVDAFRGTEILLSNVNIEYCDKFVDFLRYDYESPRGKLRMTTARSYIYLFSSVLNQAVAEGHIKKNPMHFVTVHERITRERPVKLYLTIEEVKRLMNEPCPVISRPQVKQAYLFSLFTGLSCSDILSLHWKDIKAEADRTTVCHSSKKNRIPLSAIAKRWLPVTSSRRGLVFKGLPQKTEITNILKKWQQKACIEKTLNFTLSRNTFAYLLLSTRTDAATAASLLGIDTKAMSGYLAMVDYQSPTQDEKFSFLQL